jgi:hypothetical protein
LHFKPSDHNSDETLRGPKCVSQIISIPLESIEQIEEAQNQIKKEKEMVLPAVSVADVHTQL